MFFGDRPFVVIGSAAGGHSTSHQWSGLIPAVSRGFLPVPIFGHGPKWHNATRAQQNLLIRHLTCKEKKFVGAFLFFFRLPIVSGHDNVWPFGFNFTARPVSIGRDWPPKHMLTFTSRPVIHCYC